MTDTVPAAPSLSTDSEAAVVLQFALEHTTPTLGETCWQRQARGLDVLGYEVRPKAAPGPAGEVELCGRRPDSSLTLLGIGPCVDPAGHGPDPLPLHHDAAGSPWTSGRADWADLHRENRGLRRRLAIAEEHLATLRDTLPDQGTPR